MRNCNAGATAMILNQRYNAPIGDAGDRELYQASKSRIIFERARQQRAGLGKERRTAAIGFGTPMCLVLRLK